ncbi:transport protein TonB [Candidatus Venteria ishoeyi]|uniref:Protein TonB n=3 Tax=Candidatus Venteria ishoeyi TaxID=1899563 RepID=A0A1H6FD60_9GAMM|nr:transport protein TonB [Candidatus Venteria ishoeyi]
MQEMIAKQSVIMEKKTSPYVIETLKQQAPQNLENTASVQSAQLPAMPPIPTSSPVTPPPEPLAVPPQAKDISLPKKILNLPPLDFIPQFASLKSHEVIKKPPKPPEKQAVIPNKQAEPGKNRLSTSSVSEPLVHAQTKPVAASKQSRIIKADSNLIPLRRIDPVYPPRARRKHIEGRVTIEFIVTEQGAVSTPVVVKAIPAGIFEEEALQAIKRWKFSPKYIDGEVVRQRARQVMLFKLK